MGSKMVGALGGLLLLVVILSSTISGAARIDAMKHEIFSVTGKNFDSQVNSHRQNGVVVVLFYKDDTTVQSIIDNEYNDFAEEVKGMVKVVGVDCDEWSTFCDKQHVESYPAIVVYPPQPFAPIPYTGERTVKAMTDATMKHVPSTHVKNLSDEAKAVIDAFVTTNVSVPKVLLFSERNSAPVLFNALANSFYDRMSFGFVSASRDELVKRFDVKKFPTLMVLQGELKPGKSGDVYEGELKFPAIYNFLNIRSETFVKGGGYASEKTAEEIKPWLVQKVPEITGASHQDVCFRQTHLCVIWITKDGPPSNEEMKMLEDVSEKYEVSSTERQAKFKFSWLHGGIERNFVEMVGADQSILPTVIIFNPHKRLRFLKLNKTGSQQEIERLIETILGGDARFTNVKGQKLSPFAARSDAEPTPKKDEL